MDSLGTVLRSLRLRSAMISRAHLRGRWGVHTRGIAGMLLHGVVEGRATLTRDDAKDEPVTLEAGDIVLLTRGDAHALTHEARAEAVPIAFLSSRQTGAVPTLEYGTSGAETRIVCGRVELDHPAAQGLVALLPSVIVARAGEGSRRKWVESTLALLDEEVQLEGAGARVRSLVDALFVHALSAAETNAPSSLVAAARDEHIGRALAMVHAEPARAWSAADLAAAVGLSRTRFFDRFTELVGEPPAKYVARWRVHAAADLLKQKTLSTAEVAERVGYSSEDALTKVFRRYLDMTPAQWRKQHEAGAH